MKKTWTKEEAQIFEKLLQFGETGDLTGSAKEGAKDENMVKMQEELQKEMDDSRIDIKSMRD